MAVVGAADALQKPADSLGCADLQYEIDIAPVDAQVERRGGDGGAQIASRHRRFHLLAVIRRQAAVMQGDGQLVDVEVALRGRPRAEQVGLVGGLNVERVAIELGVDGDRFDPHLLAAADYAECDFATVGDQN